MCTNSYLMERHKCSLRKLWSSLLQSAEKTAGGSTPCTHLEPARMGSCWNRDTKLDGTLVYLEHWSIWGFAEGLFTEEIPGRQLVSGCGQCLRSGTMTVAAENHPKALTLLWCWTVSSVNHPGLTWLNSDLSHHRPVQSKPLQES